MAGFTTLALIGLAGAAGLIGGKKIAKGKTPAPTTPAPTAAASTIAAPPPPPSATQTQSAGVYAGLQAAAKTKRKMVPPKIGSRDGVFSTQPVGRAEPKTLVGSGY